MPLRRRTSTAHAAGSQKRANPISQGGSMRIKLSSVFVEDQDQALRFYTEVLGFVKKHDVPVGGGVRWITVVSPEEPEGTELVLEPGNPAAVTFKRALYEDHIPATAFVVDDIQKEYARLRGLGVAFRMEPTPMGSITAAVFDDTCGNLIQIFQPS
jgi:catechol 2,3-dioxygenase-like lactoylglutathione lyase family enzyme